MHYAGEHLPNTPSDIVVDSFGCKSSMVTLIDGLPGHKCYLEEDLVRDTNLLTVRHFGIDHHFGFCYHSQSMIGALEKVFGGQSYQAPCQSLHTMWVFNCSCELISFV